eukprot:Nitzschia sp. Nitz4//scaffold301_size22573//2700//3792//NITZ4_008549-RA/size22573-processed-gene-0.16-mRNA-1//1//CDS//3329547001//8508//frame0
MNIEVFAQETKFNQRLSSMLTSVLQRRLRPSHTRAIEEKAERLSDALQQQELPTLGILLVGTFAEEVAPIVQLFGRQYRLEVVPISTDHQHSQISPWQRLARIEKTMHALAQSNCPVILVGLEDQGMELVYQLLSTLLVQSHGNPLHHHATEAAAGAAGSSAACASARSYLTTAPTTGAEGSGASEASSSSTPQPKRLSLLDQFPHLLGVVMVAGAMKPTISSTFSLPQSPLIPSLLSLPHLLLLSRGLVLDTPSVLQDFVQSNPHSMVVTVGGNETRGVIRPWANQDAAWVWLGRTIAKYAQAVSQLRALDTAYDRRSSIPLSGQPLVSKL